MHNALTTIATRAALVVALASPFTAHAGLVTGNWDPQFGPPLPNLSWAIRAEFSVPQTCIDLGNGDHSAGLIACAASVVNYARLRLFDTTADAGSGFYDSTPTSAIEDFFSVGTSLAVTGVRVLNGQVIGVATTTNTSGGTGVGYPYVPAALGNNFGLGFALDGPNVICIGCTALGYDDGADDITAPRGSLIQVLTTFNDNGTAKLVDARGNAIGVRLDGGGQVIGLTGTPVPEPGSLPLVLGALAAVAWLARRRPG